MVRIALSVVVMLALTLSVVGGTFAGWTDTEESENYIATGSIDLKVSPEEPVDFQDDKPWGSGLEDFFYITDLGEDETHTRYLLLWNAGNNDGIADLHLKIDDDPEGVAGDTDVTIWYDTDGNGVIDLDDEEVASGTMESLACDDIPLGDLLANEERPLQIQLETDWEPAIATLTFNMMFSLLTENPGFSDTEENFNLLQKAGEGLTPGFWQGAIGAGDGSGNGQWLWNEENDPDWTVAGGVGTNPFIHTMFFNSFFTSHPDLNPLTMMDIVGTGGGENPVRKAARDVVAAYLNASFGMNYPLDTTEISSLWDDAISNGTFMELHIMLDTYNNLGYSF